MISDAALRFANARFGYGNSLVFDGLDLSVSAGRITAFCGPNGSGKSTALRAMRGLLDLDSGIVDLMGKPVADWPAKALAREVAMLSQSPSATEELRVSDLVMLGRYAWSERFRGPSENDRAAVDKAIHACDLVKFRNTPIGALSGGQLQRAWIALVLAQDAPVLLLDEPTNHLDIAHALEVLDLACRLNRDHARTVVIVLHDLNYAARYADEVVLFQDGAVFAQGSVDEMFEQSKIASAFGIDCDITCDPRTGRPHVFAYGHV